MTNQNAQPMIVFNPGNWKPCKDGSVFSFVKTFTDSFKFISRSGVDLQQNHQGAGIWRNAIIPNSKEFNLKTRMHFLRFKISSRKCYVNVKFKDEVVFHSLVRLEAHKRWSYAMPWIQGNEKKKSSIKIKSIMNVWKTCYIKMHGYNL